MTTRLARAALLTALGTLSLAGCSFDITNPNSPDPIGNNPSRARVAAAATGLLIGTRSYYPGWIVNTSIIGRDGYRFDGSEPRYTTEALTGQLDAGGFIGGSQWAAPYRNIRGANELLRAVPTASTLTAEEVKAVQGFAHTMQALDFLNVLVAHTQDSIPIDVGTDPTAAPAPFVTNSAAYDHVEALLDQGLTELQAAGGAFPFDLTSGFTGFDTPATFAQFNRALKARVDILRGKWAQALTDLQGSFVDSTQSFDLGVYHTFSTGSGDNANTFLSASVRENFAHPDLADSAQTQPGGAKDARFLAKVAPRTPQTNNGLTSGWGWIRYAGPTSPVPIIRNEELILIRAEANIQLNNLAAARTDLNTVRVKSGGLAPLGPGLTQAQLRADLLYERRYSLVFEWGHHWIDARRYGLLGQLRIDRPGDVVYSTFPIPSDEVLARK